VNECAADTYEDATATDASRAIGVGSPTLGAFTPPCLKIKVGQTVTFEGAFASHPLSPATPIEGNPENPITETLTGTSAEFTFAEAGTFPFYCELHGSAAGLGMAGVIYVVP
jgi:plastocyanin